MMACKCADWGIETLNLGQLNTNRPSRLLHLKNFLVWGKSSELVYLFIINCCFVGVTPDQSVRPVSTQATSLQGVCSTTSRNSTTNCDFYHGFFVACSVGELQRWNKLSRIDNVSFCPEKMGFKHQPDIQL